VTRKIQCAPPRRPGFHGSRPRFNNRPSRRRNVLSAVLSFCQVGLCGTGEMAPAGPGRNRCSGFSISWEEPINTSSEPNLVQVADGEAGRAVDSI